MSGTPGLTCREAVERLWAYIDGELPEGESAAVQQHLDACSECYPHYDYQKAFGAFLHSRAREKAPPALRRQIFLRLLAEDRAESAE
jgi:mycothiol system anti-sigma-R factor